MEKVVPWRTTTPTKAGSTTGASTSSSRMQSSRGQEALSYLPVLLGVGFGLYWFAFIRSYGLEFSFDSTEYMSRALAMRFEGDYQHNPVWPPVYSIILSFAMRVTPFPADAAAWLAGVLITAQLSLFALLTRRVTGDVVVQVLAVVALATFTPFVFMYKYVWSEGLFSVLLTGAFCFFLRHSRDDSARDLIACATFIGLCAVTRFVGIVAIGVFVLYGVWRALVNRGRWPWTLTIIAAAVSAAPIVTYVVFNFIRSGTLFGVRAGAEVAFADNIKLVATTLFGDLQWWLIPLAGAAAVWMWALRGRRDKNRTLLMNAIVLIAISYTALLLYTASHVQIDPIGTRYFSPIYFLLFLFALTGLAHATAKNVGNASTARRRWLRGIVYILFLVGIAVNVRKVQEYRGAIVPKPKFGVAHHSAGYDVSPTATELAELFDRILRRDGEMTITVVHDYRLIPPRPAVGRSLFYRAASIVPSLRRGATFDGISDGDYTLWVTRDARRFPIRCRAIPRVTSDRELVAELRLLLEREGCDRLWLLLYQHKSMLVGAELPALVTEEMDDDYFYIPPYSVHELTLRR